MSAKPRQSPEQFGPSQRGRSPNFEKSQTLLSNFVPLHQRFAQELRDLITAFALAVGGIGFGIAVGSLGGTIVFAPEAPLQAQAPAPQLSLETATADPSPRGAEMAAVPPPQPAAPRTSPVAPATPSADQGATETLAEEPAAPEPRLAPAEASAPQQAGEATAEPSHHPEQSVSETAEDVATQTAEPAAMPAPEPSSPQEPAAQTLAQTPLPARLAPPVPVVDEAPSHAMKPLRAPSVAPKGTGRPRIAIVIDDLGYSAQTTRRVAQLKAPLTLAFLPYGKGVRGQTDLARQQGHEIWAHIPMEPLGRDDPGPKALRVSAQPEINLSHFSQALDIIGPVVGFNNHMGSRFTGHRESLSWIMNEAQARGLYFLDSRTNQQSVALELAQGFQIPSLGRDIFLDHPTPDPEANVRRQLKAAERVARRQGHAIAIGHPHGATLRVLRPWLETLDDKGIDLVSVGALIVEKGQPPEIEIDLLASRP